MVVFVPILDETQRYEMNLIPHVFLRWNQLLFEERANFKPQSLTKSESSHPAYCSHINNGVGKKLTPKFRNPNRFVIFVTQKKNAKIMKQEQDTENIQ